MKTQNQRRKYRHLLMGITIGCALWAGPAVAIAQGEVITHMEDILQEQQKNILKQIKGEPAIQETEREKTRTYICPKDGREFQLTISTGDVELLDGKKQIYCPYDGFKFYPTFSTLAAGSRAETTGLKRQENAGEWYLVRSPLTGKEFRAKIDVKELLAGNTVLTSPFDGTQFRFAPQILTRGSQPGMKTIVSPTSGRKFGAVVNEDSSEVLIDPYTGKPIPPSAQVFAAQEGEGVVERTAAEKQHGELRKKSMSKIERMFAGVETEMSPSQGELEQFGYSFFPSDAEIMQWRERKALFSQQAVFNSGMDMSTGNSGGIGGFSGLEGRNLQGAQSNLLMMSGFFPSVLASRDYILGPGDILIVYLWGKIQQTFPLQIDAEGKVFLPEVGPIQLLGTTFAQSEEIIKQKLSDKFANFQINVSMGRLRDISVFIFGEVKIPGAHHVNVQSALLQTLFMAGGPTKTGTLRKIKLVRDNEERVIDLYSVFIEGKKNADLQIQQNDIILVPPIGDVVMVKGGVKRPAIYELTSSISLTELIQLAGGLTARSYGHRIQVERVVGHQKITVEDVEFPTVEKLEEEAASIQIENGDVVSVFPISPVRYNYVSLEGNVLYPGDYEWREGMTLKVLLEKAGGLSGNAYTKRADVVRSRTEGLEEIPIDLEKLYQGDADQDLALQQWDLVKVYDREEVQQNRFVEIHGAVWKEGVYPLSVGMGIRDLIFKTSGVEPQADLDHVELIRTDVEKGVELVNINLKEILEDEKGDSDFPLQEGDKLFIRLMPDVWHQIKADVSGEVVKPGEYIVQRGDTISSLLERAGGFTKFAYPRGAVFRRNSIKTAQEELFNQFMRKEQQMLLQEQASLGEGFSSKQADARTKLLESQDNVLANPRPGLFSGRLIIHLGPFDQFTGSRDDVILQDGDSLYIPPLPSYVLVMNTQQQLIAATYEEGKGVDYYLAKLGGLRRYDDGRSIYLISATGEVRSRFIKTMPVLPGDTIVIPQKLQYRTAGGLVVKDTISTLYQLGLGAIAVASIND
ncbi:MAG: SLBB domain-containing protein [Candidatus Omnitrophica bacterium]|nr:SLBB domain-containing protein [Candidatus Omnitrophota bacterium]